MYFDDYRKAVFKDFFAQEVCYDGSSISDVAKLLFDDLKIKVERNEIDDIFNSDCADLRNYINFDKFLMPLVERKIEDKFETLCDDMWDDDAVTGNGGGGYCSYSQAEANIKDVIFDNEFHDQCNQLDLRFENVLKDPISVDATARCLAFDEQRYGKIQQEYQNRVCCQLTDMVNEERKKNKLKPIGRSLS